VPSGFLLTPYNYYSAILGGVLYTRYGLQVISRDVRFLIDAQSKHTYFQGLTRSRLMRRDLA
jgi:hypothetical protein